MPASSAEARARWRKRKREQRARYKLKGNESEEVYDENEDEDDQDMDPPQNQETEDDDQNHSANRTNKILREKESEKLADGGIKISEFPIAIKKVVIRPHSSVFAVVEAERAARTGENRIQGQGCMAVLENISYGQLQALSAVPRNSPSLLATGLDETACGSVRGSYVIEPPKIVAGRGVTMRLGPTARMHVLPAHSAWFLPHSVHRLERQVVPHFFTGKSTEHTSEKYMEIRNLIVAKYLENPEKHISDSDCKNLVDGLYTDDLTRIMRFLDHWGIINYCATPLKLETWKEGTYLCENSSNELCVPSAVLKSIDSLLQFDKPKCRLKAADVYPDLASEHDDESDLDATIREQLINGRCHNCSRSIPTFCYQSQKEDDLLLCLDCFHEGRFVAGHSSLDFLKFAPSESYETVDGDSWTDQETLLMLEGMQIYNENWNKIAGHVGSKSKAQCILRFLRLPLDGASLDFDVPGTTSSSTLQGPDNHVKLEENSNGISFPGINSESKFPFSNSGNPVMTLVAFLESELGPRVAAACAHASLASLLKDGVKEQNRGETQNSSQNGSWSHHDGEAAPLSAERVRAAAKDGLAAAAVKAKLFADHEEREIQRLSANIINHQLKRLELKLKQFAEVETLLMRECEQMERARQRSAAERISMKSSQFGSPGVSLPTAPAVGTATVNNALGNGRQQIFDSQQPFVSGYGHNQPPHSHVQQQGIYGLGPRLPISSIQTPSPTQNAMSNG